MYTYMYTLYYIILSFVGKHGKSLLYCGKPVLRNGRCDDAILRNVCVRSLARDIERPPSLACVCKPRP